MHPDVSKDKRLALIKRLLDELERDYKIDKKDILELTEEIKIPISLFRAGLSSLELIVKYLIENKGLAISSVTRLTMRSKQSIWQAYNNSKKKHPGKFREESSPYDFPVSIIANRKYSVLESIVKFLRDKSSLSYAQIAGLLSRDQRTVWTVYNRTKKK